MVHTMVLPVLTMLRTVLITMAAALASSPANEVENSSINDCFAVDTMIAAIAV